MQIPSPVVAPNDPLRSCYVAVIGSGIAAARELHREGHLVVVFEKGDRVGGMWVYTSQVESDPIGLDPSREIVHSSLYESLRTNLPRETMGFMDYPFVTREGEGRDPRRFPSHREVAMYLQDFARDFGIEEMVRFESEAVSVEMTDDEKWKVISKRKKPVACKTDGHPNDFLDHEVFDAVVVCSGHYTQLYIAEIPGINLWPGKQIHCHNYRTPEPFMDQVIILIGDAASAADLSIELAGVAKEVHIASRSAASDKYGKELGYDNMWRHPMAESGHEDGAVVFRDGSIVVADTILYCTGHKQHLPFLKTNGVVTVDDNRVIPLYMHAFPPLLAQWLSFVGVPYKVFPFPFFEAQSKWIAGVLSARIVLPSQKDMMEDIANVYLAHEVSATPKHRTHDMHDSGIDYHKWVASQLQCPIPILEQWRIQMFHEIVKNRCLRPASFRDEWEDDHLILEAQEDFSKYISNRAAVNDSIC